MRRRNPTLPITAAASGVFGLLLLGAAVAGTDAGRLDGFLVLSGLAFVACSIVAFIVLARRRR